MRTREGSHVLSDSEFKPFLIELITHYRCDSAGGPPPAISSFKFIFCTTAAGSKALSLKFSKIHHVKWLNMTHDRIRVGSSYFFARSCVILPHALRTRKTFSHLHARRRDPRPSRQGSYLFMPGRAVTCQAPNFCFSVTDSSQNLSHAPSRSP